MGERFRGRFLILAEGLGAMSDKDKFIQALQNAIAPSASPFGSPATAAPLFYPSETDAALNVIVWDTEVVNPAFLRQQLNCSAEVAIEERPPSAFFDRVTCDAPGTYCAWQGSDAESLAHQYQQLRNLMQTHLEQITFYRVGQIEVKAYVVGRYDAATWISIATLLVET